MIKSGATEIKFVWDLTEATKLIDHIPINKDFTKLYPIQEKTAFKIIDKKEF